MEYWSVGVMEYWSDGVMGKAQLHRNIILSSYRLIRVLFFFTARTLWHKGDSEL